MTQESVYRVGIVGPSYGFDMHWAYQARERIGNIIRSHMPCTVVSGGADGVDSWAEEIAKYLGCETDIKRPADGHHHWPKKGECKRGCYGFRARNVDIAKSVNILYCFQIKERIGGYCYHCLLSGHKAHGGCWTMRYARALDVPPQTETVLF